MNLRHFYRELIEDATEQGFLSYQYYEGICFDLVDIIQEEKK